PKNDHVPRRSVASASTALKFPSSLSFRPNAALIAVKPSGRFLNHEPDAVVLRTSPGSRASGCFRNPYETWNCHSLDGLNHRRADQESSGPGSMMSQRLSSGSRPLKSELSMVHGP